ncbi:pentapeptide repeat-containing protein [uncultured Kordia sp.]|uniref:pentapeptide repeat-containing protein n=1 Tax=uncultured Kordia sp. TaxID=507699 RepID=UPI00262D879F|nr:pentapeptide repeat-containing protein [uncultured Kordia sp.]
MSEEVNIEKLKQENEALRNELDRIQESKQKSHKQKFWILKKWATFFIGVRLKKSILNALDEFDTNKNLSKDTVADLASNIIWRFTRIGIITLLIALLPTILLFQQNQLIKSQNKLFGVQNEKVQLQNDLIKKQNKRIDQQTFLTEASRRSSQMFIMGEVLSDINEELESANNEERVLSNALVGRIISLSMAMKPYRYLENDSLIQKPLSPERGQLLISLIESRMDSLLFINRIIKNANFNYAELQSANMKDANLKWADLRASNFKHANLGGADLTFADLSDSDMSFAKMIGGTFFETDFSNANLHGANFGSAKLIEANFNYADLTDANLWKVDATDVIFSRAIMKYVYLVETNLTETNLDYVDLTGANLHGTNFYKADMTNIVSLDSARVHRKDWLQYIKDEKKVKGAERILREYKIDSIHNGVTYTYMIVKKRK